MKTLKMKTLKELGLAVPEILLPKKIDTEKWAVIACDQYTQNKEYWENVKKICGTEPSALNLILPEIYLGEKDKTQRIEKIRSTMNEYLKNGVFAEPKKEFIYIERTTAYGRKRCGLLAAIDLDSYEWKPFSKALVRATEATIVERLPPRMEIRKGAPLELPHIMLLVNDANCSLVEQTGEAVKKSGKKPEYSGTLMQNGGEITGWGIESDQEKEKNEKKLNEIAEQNTESDGSVFLFSVGDGNHSLATAKAVWEEHKKALEKLKENVSERLSTLEKATCQPLDTVIPKHFPKRKCHILNQSYHTDEEMDMLIKQLMNKDKNHLYIIGNNRIGSFLPLEDATQNRFGNYAGVFIIDPNGTDELDEGDYLSVCYQGNSHQHKSYFPMIQEYADKHHLILSGDLLEFLWIDIHQSANYGEHITELQIKAEASKNTERACSKL